MNLEIFNNDLIPVYTTDTGEKVVLGRELHEKLGVNTKYTDWFRRMCKYPFVKNEGYVSFSVSRSDARAGKPRTEHLLYIKTAREIARMQRTEKGSKLVEKLSEFLEQDVRAEADNNLTVFSTELIPVYITDEGKKVVLGRELHEKLGIISEYSLWFQRMCEYGRDKGFKEGESYFPVFFNSEKNCALGGRPKQDHIITLRMAKHIATIQKSDIAFQIREKLFDLEEAVNEQKAIVLDSYMIEDPIERAKRWIQEEERRLALEAENKLLLPKAEGFDQFLNTEGLTCFRDAASLLGVREKKFIDWMLKKEFIYRKQDKKRTLAPRADYQVKPDNPNGWFVFKKRKSQHDKDKYYGQTRITSHGLEALRKLLEKEGMIQ